MPVLSYLSKTFYYWGGNKKVIKMRRRQVPFYCFIITIMLIVQPFFLQVQSQKNDMGQSLKYGDNSIEFSKKHQIQENDEIFSNIKSNNLCSSEIKYFIDNGRDSVFYKLQTPHAVYQENQTFIGYMSEPYGGPEVISYNHITKSWINPVKVDTYSYLNQSGRVGPSMWINESGHIWIIHGSFDGNPPMPGLTFHATTMPYDISSWDEKVYE